MQVVSSNEPLNVLFLCTGNSARSQMAAGFLRSFDPGLEVSSAGTDPDSRVNPNRPRGADAPNLSILQGAQQLDLHRGARFAYFVQK